jgi:catechol-2,3-dioxygenase
MTRVAPRKLAHIVYRTHRFEEMLEWYQFVFDAHVQMQNPALAFLTYEDEHHRIALANLDVIKPDDTEVDQRGLVGVDHVAYTYDSLEDLFGNYQHLKQRGIEPYWCVHHGLTVSMYYADPDGNQMEFQVDAFDTMDQSGEFMRGADMAENPVGVEYDPEDWLAQVRAGRSFSDFLKRQADGPASPIRGVLGD